MGNDFTQLTFDGPGDVGSNLSSFISLKGVSLSWGNEELMTIHPFFCFTREKNWKGMDSFTLEFLIKFQGNRRKNFAVPMNLCLPGKNGRKPKVLEFLNSKDWEKVKYPWNWHGLGLVDWAVENHVWCSLSLNKPDVLLWGLSPRLLLEICCQATALWFCYVTSGTHSLEWKCWGI